MELTEIATATLDELRAAVTATDAALDVATREEQDAYVALSRAETRRRVLQRQLVSIGYMIQLRERQEANAR